MSWRTQRERKCIPRPQLARWMGWRVTDVVALEEGKRPLSPEEEQKLCRMLGLEAPQALRHPLKYVLARLTGRALEDVPRPSC